MCRNMRYESRYAGNSRERYGCFPLLFYGTLGDGISRAVYVRNSPQTGTVFLEKEQSYMKKMSRGLKVCVLSLALAVTVVSVQGCKGAEEAGKSEAVTATPSVEVTSGADAEKETAGRVTEPVAPTEGPIQVTEPVVPTEAPAVTEDETQKDASQTLPEYEFTVENELYFEFAYEYEVLTFRSENPEIVQAMFMEGEYDYEEGRETTGVMLYGIANGTTELVVSDTNSGQEVRWKVTVEKPDTESGKQKLIDWLLANGETNDIGDKELAEGAVEDGGRATVEYATMDENINFYFKEMQGEEKVEWNLIPTPEENTEYYITMRIGEDFVTATVDLATYNGEELVFEKGWFGIPVEEDMQKKANEASGRAYEVVKDLLYEATGMTMGEVVR